VLEEGPLTQDEAFVVELEARRVVKDDFAHVAFVLFGFFEFDPELFCHGMRVFEKLVVGILIDKPLGFQ
jgi:hypothetical protein